MGCISSSGADAAKAADGANVGSAAGQSCTSREEAGGAAVSSTWATKVEAPDSLAAGCDERPVALQRPQGRASHSRPNGHELQDRSSDGIPVVGEVQVSTPTPEPSVFGTPSATPVLSPDNSDARMLEDVDAPPSRPQRPTNPTASGKASLDMELSLTPSTRWAPGTNGGLRDSRGRQVDVEEALPGSIVEDVAENTQAPAPEAPTSEAKPGGLQHAPTQQLTKQQQEEAAKLAETRRRFDNQRYHQATQQTATVLPMFAGVVPASGPVWTDTKGPNIIGVSPTAARLGRDMEPELQEALTPDWRLGAYLPAGLLEIEELDVAAAAHPQIEPAAKLAASFDADDEALMREILEDWDTH